MKFLLDTNVLIDHLRGKQQINPIWIENGGAISIISYAELFYGAYKSNRPKEIEDKIRQMILELGIRVIPLEESIAQPYAQTKALLETKGERIDEFDLLIGTTALILDLTLVTRNRKHFDRIPELQIFDM